METGVWRRTPVFMGAQGLWGDPGVCEGNIQLFGGTEQFVGGWQGFGGTLEFEGTRMSEMMLGVFWDPERIEYWAVHRCVLLQVPPPGELRAFSRCLGELLQVWGHSSVRVLDLLPLLRALPNPGLRKLLQLVQHRDTFVETQIQRHQACPSPPPDTVLGALLGRNPGARGGPLSPPRLHMALVDLFIGGTETTAAALGWAVAFLLHRPELQARLRAELQGAQGPPGPGDVGRLPLLQATVSETLRLRPPAPLALPHCALRHTSLGGLPVAAGTVLVPNLLAAQQDPDIWQHPEVFLPGMWIFLHSECPPPNSWVSSNIKLGSPSHGVFPDSWVSWEHLGVMSAPPMPEPPKPHSPSPKPVVPPPIPCVPPKTCSSPLPPPRPPQTPETPLRCLNPLQTGESPLSSWGLPRVLGSL
ncbi:steroid 21-hydroxylase-like isoform X2 [Molothrus ater]|uniref:steroid 21-hydroxylase-like isoform X2 n=1 Tax=Molothrus ater TaxID=84834 RepID=UPI00174E824B|nr:steroid 21-hydroxylase-like isoform X2 [Molothrus ater]